MTKQTKFQLDEISNIENYFIEEINQRKSCSKKLSKYVAVFDYIDQALIVCFNCNKWWSINCFVYKYCSCTSWNSKCKPYFIFSSNNTTGIVKKITEYNKKKKRDKIIMLSKSKLNSIETLILQTLTDMEKIHEEFTTILKEKDKY